jgi:hypothetical protein
MRKPSRLKAKLGYFDRVTMSNIWTAGPRMSVTMLF